MERITVKIGRVGQNATTTQFRDRTQAIDIEWLSKVLCAGKAKAQRVVSKLWLDPDRASTYVYVYLTYEQLGRYTAFRRVDDLADYWKYPNIAELEEDYSEADIEIPPIELRPGVNF